MLCDTVKIWELFGNIDSETRGGIQLGNQTDVREADVRTDAELATFRNKGIINNFKHGSVLINSPLLARFFIREFLNSFEN